MTFKVFDELPQDAVNIRTAVFMEEQGFVNEFDEDDRDALHIVVYDDSGKAAGVCRLMKREGGFVLGRVAVLKEYRGGGVGRLIIAEAERIAREKGGAAIMLHAQCRVSGFYGKMGYMPFGDEDDDEGCPHIRMKKVL